MDYGINIQIKLLDQNKTKLKKILPLIRVINSSCLIFPTARSIFKAINKVKVILSDSYKPLTEYLNTSNDMNSIMFDILFCVMGDFWDLLIKG
jgi:hypothetical protein